MIWTHFPVGMSFPVEDFSDETKKACWQIALSALAATEIENRTEMVLYDNCASGTPGSAEKEYLCILDHRHVKQSRVNIPLWKNMSLLMSHLSLHYPFYQANALDGFGNYVSLATVTEDGKLSLTEEGKGILPDQMPVPMQTNTGSRVFIALPAEKDKLGYANALKQIGRAAAELGKQVIYCPIPNGSTGTAYAFTYALQGRFEWVDLRKDAPKQLIGILPRKTVVTDLADLNTYGENSARILGELIRKILDLGYRNMLFAVDGFCDTDSGEGLREALSENTDGALDARLSECAITLLSEKQDSVSGSLKCLIELGAQRMEAMEFFEKRTHAAEQIDSSDTLVIKEPYEKRLSHPRNRSFTVSEQEMKEPELLYCIFARKLTQQVE